MIESSWFSLGSDCQVAYHLKRRGLRSGMLPFDWALSSFDSMRRILEADFHDLFSDDSLCLEGSGKRLLVDRRSGLVLPHDAARFAARGAACIRDRYLPGINRFREVLHGSGRVILIRRNMDERESSWLENFLSSHYPKAHVIVVRVNAGAASAEEKHLCSERSLAYSLPARAGWMGSLSSWDWVLDRLSCPSRAARAWLWTASRILGSDWRCVKSRMREPARQTHLSREAEDLLIAALTAAEDRRYGSHRGVDGAALARACLGMITGRPLGGGSTIEQQLYRTLSERRERTVARKARELLGARLLSSLHTKRALALLYLRVAYFGSSMNGLAEASSRLRVDLATLTPMQAAHLVSHLKYPLPKAPSTLRLRQISRRTRYVLNRMTLRDQAK